MSKQILLHSKRSAAHLIGVSERTIHEMIATKQLRVRRVGRRVLVPTSELTRFAEKGARKKS
jgi:excisionase family DNA binding protein